MRPLNPALTTNLVKRDNGRDAHFGPMKKSQKGWSKTAARRVPQRGAEDAEGHNGTEDPEGYPPILDPEKEVSKVGGRVPQKSPEAPRVNRQS